ncbi:MAG: hypothetical protein ACLS45_01220 [Subdoligranulum sp.]
MGQFDYKDGFGDFCSSRIAVLIGSVYGSRLRVGGIVHCVHCPHSFPQFIHLLLCQRRNGRALFAACHIRGKDRQDVLPADVIYIIVGNNVLAVVLYGIGDFFQPVAVFFGQGVYGFAHGDGRCVGGIGGKEDAVSRAGHKRHKADYNDYA